MGRNYFTEEQKIAYLSQENEFLKKYSCGPTGKLGVQAKLSPNQYATYLKCGEYPIKV